jgi:hypothetical protein
LGGTLDTILLNGITTGLDIDDSIAINPVDGSLWLPTVTTGTNRAYLRVDVVNATLQSPNVYLANVTQEFTATDFNVGQNSLAFSPDGRYLAAAAPDGSDTLYIFETVPEPTTFTVAGMAMLVFSAVRRRVA